MFWALTSVVWAITGMISAGFFAALSNPQTAVMVVTLLFYLRPMEKAAYPYPIMMVGLLVAMFVLAFYKKPYGELKTCDRKDTKIFLLMQLYLLFNIVLFNRWNMLDIYQSYIIPAFLFYFLITEYIITAKHIRMLLLTIGTSCLIICADSLYVHFMTDPDSQVWLHYHNFSRLQNQGNWDNPNILAYLANFGIGCFFIVRSLSSGSARFIYLLPGLVFLPTIFLTGSRGALLQLSVMGFIFFMRGKKSIGTIVFIAVLVLAASTVLTVLTPERKYAEGSKDERIEILLHAKDAFIANPVFGVGFKLFQEHNPYRLASHNTFAQLFSELGLIGAIIFFLMLKKMLLAIHKNIDRTKDKQEYEDINYLSKGVFALCIGALIYYIFGNQLLDFIFCTTIGLLVATKRAYEVRSIEIERTRKVKSQSQTYQ